MNIYICPRCGTKFNDADLVMTKCSENLVGTYTQTHCPKCIGKPKPAYSLLDEMEVKI